MLTSAKIAAGATKQQLLEPVASCLTPSFGNNEGDYPEGDTVSGTVWQLSLVLEIRINYSGEFKKIAAGCRIVSHGDGIHTWTVFLC